MENQSTAGAWQPLCFVLLFLLSQPGYSQTFGTPKAVTNPFNGTGGVI
jgi:hypothetical protein